MVAIAAFIIARNWLLLYLEEPEQSGLYILHPDTGAMFLVIDSTGGLVGYTHVWSPEQ
jgi:hypothetical protein